MVTEAEKVAVYWVTELNAFVAPLWWITREGICACRRGAACGKSGAKHPLTPRGINDATQDLTMIHSWYEQYPEAGVCIDLRRSNMVLLGPDSVEWQEKFEGKGLHAGAAIINTGGGPGHFHYVYRRPASMPIGRINRSAEFDLMTEGVLPLPPSQHYSGVRRSWVVEPSKYLPEAPDLVVQMMQVQKETSTELPDVDYSAPPVRLTGEALEFWNGTRVVHKKGTVELDRSATMWVMGCKLAEAGATERLITETLAEWAPQHGYTKYMERPKQYEEIAKKAVALVKQAFELTPDEDILQVYSLKELLRLTFEKPPYFVEPLVPATGITLLAGASGSLKTAVIADLFLAIFQKRKWLDYYTVPEGIRVLYLDGEVGHQALQSRLISMGAPESDDLDYIYRTWRIEHDKEFEELLRLVANGNYGLILVDSISAMHNLEERTDTTVLVMKRLRQLADSVSCPIVVLANFNKSTSEKRELLERISGPSVYRNKSTCIITLRRFGGKKLMKARLQLQKNWFGQEGEARELELKAGDDGILRFSSEEWAPPTDEDDDEPEEGKPKKISAAEAASTLLITILAAVPADTVFTQKELVSDLREIDGVSREVALAAINAFIAQGSLAPWERRGKGGSLVTWKV